MPIRPLALTGPLPVGAVRRQCSRTASNKIVPLAVPGGSGGQSRLAARTAGRTSENRARRAVTPDSEIRGWTWNF
jgi:hypothetical protein